MKSATAPVTALALGLAAVPAAPLHAEGRYIGEVIAFAGNFCPSGTLPADGRLLAISRHTALFALLGTRFGGDGRQTFALPDLGGRVTTAGDETVRSCVVVAGVFPSRP